MYYLDSNTIKITAKGLFAPINLYKTTTGSGESVEMFVWSKNPKNQELNVNYEFKVEYEGITYFSTDSRLKYKLSGVLYSFDIITSESIIAPAGYDFDNDGSLDGDDDILFKEGEYKISVKTVPSSSMSTDNICNSKYCTEYEMLILSAPVLEIENGIVKWEQNLNATNYEVIVNKFNVLNFNYLKTENLTTNTYDLSGLPGGIYEINVKATSTNNDVLNSVVSESIIAFKLAEISSMYVDDGNLILTASKYFNYALITFEYGGSSETIEFINENLETNLENLTILNYSDTDNYLINMETYMQANGLNLLNGKTYNVSVKLIGSRSIEMDILGEPKTIGIISSNEKMSALKTLKFKPIIKTVEDGKYNFMSDSSYCEVDLEYKTFEKAETSELVYDFENIGVDNVDNLWKETIIYKIVLSVKDVTGGSDEVYTLLAIDYYSCAKGNIDYNESYIDLNGIKLNIFKDNIIDMTQDEIIVYTTEIIQTGVLTNYSNSVENHVDLTSGGTFILDVTMLGGDSNGNIGYLTSEAKTVTFVRYGTIVPSNESGNVTFIDGRKNSDQSDCPIYAVFAKSISTDETTMFYLYYSSSTQEDVEYVVGELYQEFKFGAYSQVEFSSIHANTINFDLGQYIGSGAYAVKIKTLAGLDTNVENNIYYLDAKEIATEYNYYKFTNTAFEYNNGILKMPLSYIALDNEQYLYSGEYEVTLNDGESDNVYTINSASEGVTINGSNLEYIVPESIAQIGKTYTIKIRPLAKTYNSVDGFTGMLLNGTYKKNADGTTDAFVEFTKASALSVDAVEIKNGVLTWNAMGYDTVNVKVYSDAEDETFTFQAVGNEVDGLGTYSYQFSDGAYSNINGNMYVTSNSNYNISIQLVGSGNEINSDYSSNILDVQRLNNVAGSSIVSTDGVLTWDSVDGAVGYVVNIDTLKYTVSTNSLDLTKPDDNGDILSIGSNYKVVIQALGDSDLHSSLSKSTNFEKIVQVSDETIQIEDDGIVWQASSKATSYNVIYQYSGKTKSYVVTSASCEAPDDIDGAFTVLIQSFVEGENKTIASDYAEFEREIDKPAPVDNIEFFEDSFRFKVITNSSDFVSGDRLKITCNLNKKTESGDVKENISIIIDLTGNTYTYQLKDIGEYSNFTAQILRAGTFGSFKIKADKKYYNFNKYSYGNGEEQNPYTISNAEQFLNIKHFAANQKYFKLIKNIDMTLDVNNYKMGNFVVAEYFKGNLDGGDYYIENFATTSEGKQTIELRNVTKFALFGTLEDATIKNLQVGVNNISTILLNMFDSNPTDVINLSLIATGAKNSTLDNVAVKKFTIALDGSNITLSKQIKIAGLVCNAENCTITNSSADLIVNISNGLMVKSSSDYYYIAGLVTYLKGGNLLNNNTSLELIHNNTSSELDYVGGAISYSEHSAIISYVESTFKLSKTKVTNAGGIVGYASTATISNCIVKGNVEINETFVADIGGVVGRVYCSTINNTDVSIDFVNTSLASNQNLGGIVGFVDGNKDEGKTSIVDNCLYQSDKFAFEQTEYINNILNIGVYGKAYEGFESTNCV